MIYLIGGPPKCGKSTFAKLLSKKLGIPWVSADTLQSIGRAYSPKAHDTNKYPHAAMRKGKRNNDEFYQKYSPKQIVTAYCKQAKATAVAVEMMVACELSNQNDYIVEGYQVEPAFVARLCKRYGSENITTVFLTKANPELFMEDLKKSTTSNDWILTNTKKEETFRKIAEMVEAYSEYFTMEAKKHGLPCLDLSRDFKRILQGLIKEFFEKKQVSERRRG